MAKLKDTRVYGYLNVDSGVSISGVLTASTYKGDGSGLTGIVGSGSGVIVKDDGSTVGTAGTIDFGSGLSVSPISAGVVTVTGSSSSQWITASTGISTTSNVGIGTTNPGARVHVFPTSTGIAGLFSGTTSDDMVRITQLGTGNAFKVEDETNPDSTPFVIDANGYIGIGTDTINSTQGLITRLNIHAGSSYGGLRITNPTDGSGFLRGLQLIYSSTDNAYLMSSLDRQIRISTPGVEPLVLQPTSGRKVGIGSTIPNNKLDVIGSTYISDNLGIGTTNPSQKLEVVGGEIKAGRVDTSQEGGQVTFGRSTDNTSAWYIDVYGDTSTPILRFVDVSTASVRAGIDSTGNFQFDSGYGSAATVYGCRAWVNFNGTGTVSTNQTIRGSGNVSTVFKNGTGDYTINFTTALADANYSAAGIASKNNATIAGGMGINESTTPSTTALRVFGIAFGSGSNALEDKSFANIAVFR